MCKPPIFSHKKKFSASQGVSTNPTDPSLWPLKMLKQLSIGLLLGNPGNQWIG